MRFSCCGLREQSWTLQSLMDSYMIAHLHVTPQQETTVFFSIFTWFLTFPPHSTKYNLRDVLNLQTQQLWCDGEAGQDKKNNNYIQLNQSYNHK